MIKNGVDLRGLSPQMAIAYTIACGIYAGHGKRCRITSGVEGKHGPNSLHYKGQALDLGTREYPEQLKVLIRDELKEALGAQFDVVLEATHLHIEFDPKEKPVDPEDR